MIARGNFLLQARFVLNALIGGSDAEKISRHWPGYKITVENGRKFCFELEGEDEQEQQTPPPPAAPEDSPPPAPPSPPTSELDIAKLAAEQASAESSPGPILPVS